METVVGSSSASPVLSVVADQGGSIPPIVGPRVRADPRSSKSSSNKRPKAP